MPLRIGLPAQALVAAGLALGLGVGCEPRTDPARPPLPDASHDANLDVRAIVVIPDVGTRRDAPADAPLADTPGLDARADAGSSVVTIDGRIIESAWDSAASRTTTVTAGPPFVGCGLTDLLVLPTDVALLVAVRGAVDASCPAAAIVVYVDLAPAAATGLLLDGTAGADISAPLNQVLSGPLNGLASGLFPDFGWGTLLMPAGRTAGTREIGWRDVSPAPFRTPTGQVTACTTSECETSISYTSLGVARGSHTFELFARLGDGVEWAAPALPDDSPAEFVTMSLSVPVVVP